MPKDSPYKAPVDVEPIHKPIWPRRWWFLTGFAGMFILILFSQSDYTPTMSGDAVFRCPMWKYYLIEIRRAWNDSGAIGPTTGASTSACGALLAHLLSSAATGMLLVGVVKLIHYFRS